MIKMRNNIILWAVLTTALGLISAPFIAGYLSVVIFNGPAYSISVTKLHSWNQFFSAIGTYYTHLLSSNGDAFSFFFVFVVVGTLIAIVLLYAHAQNPRRVSQNSVLGNMSIIDNTTERRRRNDTWNGKGTPKNAGLVYGFESGSYLFDSKTPHCFTAGRTGSGKSRFLCLETLHLCLAAGWNVIVSDIKSELIELTGEKAAETAKVILFDLENPTKGQRFNPLQMIVDYAQEGDVQRVRTSADQLANDLVQADAKNPFFSNAARGLLSACCIAIAMEDIPEEQKNMASVCNLIDEGTTALSKDPSAPLKNYFRQLGPNHPAFSPASEFLSDGGTTAGKNVLSTVKVALRPFSAPAIRWMTSASDFTIDELITERTIVYLHVLGKDNPSNAIFSCFYNQLWRRCRAIGDTNGGKLPYRTAIIGDEWGNLPKVDALCEIVTLGRSYGLSWWGFCQNVSQMNKYNTLGDNNAGREELLGNVGIKIALSLGDETDRRWFTNLCGKRTVNTMGISKQRGGGRSSDSQSSTERSDDLIHEWDWTHRAPDTDGAIVVKAKENNAKGRNGVFRMPLVDATLTPAKVFFGLGTPEHERAKRLQYRKSLEAHSNAANLYIEVWHPDFTVYERDSTRSSQIEEDEFSAWDELM